MSYAHEYFTTAGRKSLISFSRPFALTRYAPARWVVAEEELDWLMERLDDLRHELLAPPSALRARRRATAFERDVVETLEYPDPRKRKPARGRSDSCISGRASVADAGAVGIVRDAEAAIPGKDIRAGNVRWNGSGSPTQCFGIRWKSRRTMARCPRLACARTGARSTMAPASQ